MPQTDSDLRLTLWEEFDIGELKDGYLSPLGTKGKMPRWLFQDGDVKISEAFWERLGKPKRVLLRLGPASKK